MSHAIIGGVMFFMGLFVMLFASSLIRLEQRLLHGVRNERRYARNREAIVTRVLGVAIALAGFYVLSAFGIEIGKPGRDHILANDPVVVIHADEGIAADTVSASLALKESVAEPVLCRATGVVVGIVLHDVKTTFSYGFKRLTSQERVTESTLFEIGSITKVFTCTLLSQLVLDGEVALDTSLDEIFQEFEKGDGNGAGEITLKELATHTSGLPRLPTNMFTLKSLLTFEAVRNPYKRYGTHELWHFLQAYESNGDTGGEYVYSNLGMGILGLALSRRLQQDYAQAIRGRTCEPLGLFDTGVGESCREGMQIAQAYQGIYCVGPMAVAFPVDIWSFDAPMVGAGGLLSNGKDMLEFVSLCVRPPNNALGAALRATQKPLHTMSPSSGIGLGWHINALDAEDGREVIWHNGQTGGHSGFVGFIADDHVGVVILANGRVSLESVGFQLLEYLVSECNWAGWGE